MKTQIQTISILLCIVSLSPHLFGKTTRFSSIKSKALSEVTKVIEANHQELKRIRTEIKAKMQEHSTSKNFQLEKIVEIMSNQHKELLQRKDFLNRLYFQIDTHFSSSDLKKFLIQRTKILATREITHPTNSKKSMWKFLHYLSVVLEANDDNDDAIDFAITYMNYSSISNPKKPQTFLDSQNYTTDYQAQIFQHPKKIEIAQFLQIKNNKPQTKDLNPRFMVGLSLIKQESN